MHLFKTILTAAIIFATTTFAQWGSEYTLFVNESILELSPITPFGLNTGFVSYANGYIWLGDMKWEIYSEPFSVIDLYFTSYHETLTGGQDLYIYPNETLPVQFTIPHSGWQVPENATAAGFAFCTETGYLEWEGLNNFWGCTDAEDFGTFQIWWLGDGKPEWITCVGPLGLYAEYTFNTVSG